MKKGSTIDWLSEEINKVLDSGDIDLVRFKLPELLGEAKRLERERILHSVIYSLDEDGHTGDWKIRFANDYYSKNCKEN